MPSTLADPRVASLLERLFDAASRDNEVRSAQPRDTPRSTDAWASARERSEAAQDIYMPVSPEGGRLLYTVTRAARPQTVVEFGTSYGISTIHLAAAVADNGSGRVISTELSPKKAAGARRNLAEAGLARVVSVLEGDALQTLAGVLQAPDGGQVGVVLLDGWKELYLPVLRLLEPRLAPGAVVVADDSSFASVAEYVAYVREPGNGYVSVGFPVDDGMEVSTWCGAS